MNGQKSNDAVVDASDEGEGYLFEFDLHGLTQEEIHIIMNGDHMKRLHSHSAPSKSQTQLMVSVLVTHGFPDAG